MGVMGEYLLGVDAGQTVTKAVLFDLAGRELAAGSAKSSVASPRPRWAERDMEQAWQATAGAIRECLAASGVRPAQVAAVGIAGHSDGAYLVDDSGAPVRPAITAMDTRAHQILAEWQGSGTGRRALELTGTVPFAGSPAALLAWLARHEPSTLERARWHLFCKDWLRYRLTGEIATDPTEASASFCDVRTQEYSAEACALFGLGGYARLLPPIVPSHAVAGRVTPEAARETGLAAGTPVVTGAHDVDAAALGMGAVEPGQLSLIAGTFSINQVVSTEVRLDERWQARTFLSSGRWLNMSTSPASATALEWFVRELGVPSYEQASAEVAACLDGPSTVLFHPFLYGSPHGPDAAAGFLGVRGWHTRGHLLRAVFEGVVFNHRTHVEALRSGFAFRPAARLSGGAARSAVWAQLFADGLGCAIEVPAAAETGALGAALLAGLGVGAYADLDAAAHVVSVGRRYVPDPDRVAVLDAAYAAYQEAVTALAPVWKALA